MEPQSNLGYLLHHIAFTLDRASDQVLQERLGIGLAQFKILMTLLNRKGLQQKEVAAELGQTEASISRQIKLMLETGLLITQISPRSRREHITTLTSKGERLAEKATEILNNYHAPMFADLSEKQQEKLHEILSIMHEWTCKH